MKTITVNFPAPLPAEIPCPICRFEEGRKGSGCIACERTGKIYLTVDAKIPIQRAHIIKYVANNMSAVSSELTRLYGLVPNVETVEIIETEMGNYEIVQVSSLGGAVWIANRLDEFAAPRYFHTHQELEVFKGGFENER
tara:strand:- start:280 stop:696 length:417 start_codon:yes stop_codon:yes gene_type:complete